MPLFEEEDGNFAVNDLPSSHPPGTQGLIVVTDDEFDRNTQEWQLIENIALGTSCCSIGLWGPDSYGGPLAQRPHILEALKGAALAFHERMQAWSLDPGITVITPGGQDHIRAPPSSGLWGGTSP